MGAGASANTAVAGVPQGIESRRSNPFAGSLKGLIGTSSTHHFKFALVQSDMLKDSLSDPQVATGCLKSINEAMNEAVESADAKNMREELCGCGLDVTVLELMRMYEHDEEVQQEALITVGSLAYKSDGRKLRLMDLGAGQAVIAAVSNHGHEHKVLEEGLWAAGNLSAGSEKLKDRFVELGVGAALSTTLEANAHSPDIVKTGLICLGNLCNGSSRRAESLSRRHGLAGTCVKALKRHPANTDVQAYGFFAAGNFCEANGVRGDELVRSRVVECLAEAFEAHRTVKVVQQYACKLVVVLMRCGNPPPKSALPLNLPTASMNPRIVTLQAVRQKIVKASTAAAQFKQRDQPHLRVGQPGVTNECPHVALLQRSNLLVSLDALAHPKNCCGDQDQYAISNSNSSSNHFNSSSSTLSTSDSSMTSSDSSSTSNSLLHSSSFPASAPSWSLSKKNVAVSRGHEDAPAGNDDGGKEGGGDRSRRGGGGARQEKLEGGDSDDEDEGVGELNNMSGLSLERRRQKLGSTLKRSASLGRGSALLTGNALPAFPFTFKRALSGTSSAAAAAASAAAAPKTLSSSAGGGGGGFGQGSKDDSSTSSSNSPLFVLNHPLKPKQLGNRPQSFRLPPSSSKSRLASLLSFSSSSSSSSSMRYPCKCKQELWTCLSCGKARCGRFEAKHALWHADHHYTLSSLRLEDKASAAAAVGVVPLTSLSVGHSLAVSSKNLSVWCFTCSMFVALKPESPNSQGSPGGSASAYAAAVNFSEGNGGGGGGEAKETANTLLGASETSSGLAAGCDPPSSSSSSSVPRYSPATAGTPLLPHLRRLACLERAHFAKLFDPEGKLKTMPHGLSLTRDDELLDSNGDSAVDGSAGSGGGQQLSAAAAAAAGVRGNSHSPDNKGGKGFADVGSSGSKGGGGGRGVGQAVGQAGEVGRAWRESFDKLGVHRFVQVTHMSADNTHTQSTLLLPFILPPPLLFLYAPSYRCAQETHQQSLPYCPLPHSVYCFSG